MNQSFLLFNDSEAGEWDKAWDRRTDIALNVHAQHKIKDKL